MRTTRGPVHVAINVMRARITILGFNIAIITFQVNELRALGGGITLPGLHQPVHLDAVETLFLGLALSFVAMVCYIASSAFDEVGTCTHWSLLAGDLLMYLALAQTVHGFFAPFMFELHGVSLSDPAQADALGIVNGAIVLAGSIAWAAAVYVGPAVSLARSPFSRRVTVTLGVAYLLLLTAVSIVDTAALRVQSARLGDDPAGLAWLGGLAAPLRW